MCAGLTLDIEVEVQVALVATFGIKERGTTNISQIVQIPLKMADIRARTS